MPSKKTSFNSNTFAVATAWFSALCMLSLWLLDKVGLYQGAFEQMAKWHMFFDQTFMGLLFGMLEAAVISFGAVYLFVFIYQTVAKKD